MKFDWFDWCAVVGVAFSVFVAFMLFQGPRNDRCINTINQLGLEKCR